MVELNTCCLHISYHVKVLCGYDPWYVPMVMVCQCEGDRKGNGKAGYMSRLKSICFRGDYEGSDPRSPAP